MLKKAFCIRPYVVNQIIISYEEEDGTSTVVPLSGSLLEDFKGVLITGKKSKVIAWFVENLSVERETAHQIFKRVLTEEDCDA
jgi:20S proteasome alpha/beta subunit